jgi:hypothetical protein
MARRAAHTYGITVTRTGETQLMPERGVALPLRLEIHVDDSTLPYLVDMDVAIEYGRALCHSLRATRRIDGEPVTNQQLRRIPVEAIVLQAMRDNVWAAPGGKVEFLVTSADADSVVDELRGRRRRSSSDREKLKREVVALYKELIPDNPEPRAAISQAKFISPGYVGRLLSEARRDGLLGPAPVGRAGEVPSPKKTPKRKGQR